MAGPGVLAVPAALIAEPSRAAMLDALMSGRRHTAGELAAIAAIGRAAASEHLRRLRVNGLVEMVREGRFRYYTLANETVAEVLETLALIAPPRTVRSLRHAADSAALALARTCYDHLAGRVGVGVHDALLTNRVLDPAVGGYELTAAGNALLDDWGVDIAAARASRRNFAKPCLDGTEHRFHLAGSLAAAMTTRFLELGWFTRRNGAGRALTVTPLGIERLRHHLGCELDGTDRATSGDYLTAPSTMPRMK